jgi:hypothetical protein
MRLNRHPDRAGRSGPTTPPWSDIMKSVRLFLGATLAVIVAVGVGQTQPPMPKAGPEHAVLKKMEGTWDTMIKMAGQESKGSATYKMDLGGLWLASTFEGDMMGEKFSGRGFDTYDAGKKKYVGVWFDSMSTTPMVMEGNYDAAKKTMTMVGEAPGMDGKMTKHRMVSTMPDDNTMNFAMYVADAKEPAFTIVYKRKR